MIFVFANLIWMCTKLIGMSPGCVRNIWPTTKSPFCWWFDNFIVLIAHVAFNIGGRTTLFHLLHFYQCAISVMYLLCCVFTYYSFSHSMPLLGHETQFYLPASPSNYIGFNNIFIFIYIYYVLIVSNSEIHVRRVWLLPWE